MTRMKPRTLRAFAILLAALVSLCLPWAVTAATFRVEGTISTVDAGVDEQFDVGDPFTLTFSFDPAAPDFDADPRRGSYRTAITAGTLDVGAYQVAFDGAGWIVVDNQLFPNVDSYLVTITAWNSNVAGANVGNRFPYAIELELTDPTGSAFDSDALLQAPPDLAAFQLRLFNLAFAQSITPNAAFGVQRIAGNATGISAVPIPGAAPLLSALLILFVSTISKGRWNNKRKGYRNDTMA